MRDVRTCSQISPPEGKYRCGGGGHSSVVPVWSSLKKVLDWVKGSSSLPGQQTCPGNAAPGHKHTLEHRMWPTLPLTSAADTFQLGFSTLAQPHLTDSRWLRPLQSHILPCHSCAGTWPYGDFRLWLCLHPGLPFTYTGCRPEVRERQEGEQSRGADPEQEGLVNTLRGIGILQDP